jgi:transcriptional regulator with XRE-family HTH domain
MEHAGIAILNARTALGMSLSELARRAEVDQGYLSRVERGEKSPTDRWMRSVTTALFAAMGEDGAA